jgi:hypothetical protein
MPRTTERRRDILPFPAAKDAELAGLTRIEGRETLVSIVFGETKQLVLTDAESGTLVKLDLSPSLSALKHHSRLRSASSPQ